MISFVPISFLLSPSSHFPPLHKSDTPGRADFAAFIAANTDFAVHSGITSPDYFNGPFGADRHAGAASNAAAALHC